VQVKRKRIELYAAIEANAFGTELDIYHYLPTPLIDAKRKTVIWHSPIILLYRNNRLQ